MKFHDNYYEADEDKTFILKETGNAFGYIIYLGEHDSIDNYEEVELTPENDLERRKYNIESEETEEIPESTEEESFEETEN